ncbi:hypothetical protein PSAC2689_20265 [Paraburkholderia sacchari]
MAKARPPGRSYRSYPAPRALLLNGAKTLVDPAAKSPIAFWQIVAHLSHRLKRLWSTEGDNGCSE